MRGFKEGKGNSEDGGFLGSKETQWDVLRTSKYKKVLISG